MSMKPVLFGRNRDQGQGQIIIVIKTPTYKITLLCDPLKDTILDIKSHLALIDPSMSPSSSSLCVMTKGSNSKHPLDNDELTLSFYGVQEQAKLVLKLLPQDHFPPGKAFLPLQLRDPEWDWDYSDLDDTGLSFKRGNFRYRRPIGWTRIGLRVPHQRYGEDKAWLGPGNRRDTNKLYPGEWPVSYHGTYVQNLKSIAEQGFLLSKGVRELYGPGIYTTPDIEVAEIYAEPFPLGDTFIKVVVQCRTHPDRVKRRVVEDPLEYWVHSVEDDVRPYAICFKEVDPNGEEDDGQGDARRQRQRIRRQMKNDKRKSKLGQACLCV